MVDQISTSSKLINLSEWRDIKASRALGNTVSSPNSSDDQHLQQIAQDIFDRMTQAATALVRKNSSENVQKLEQAANSLLRLEMSLADKFEILDYLCDLSPKRSELPSGNDRIINPKQEADLYIVNQLSALRTQLELLSCQDEEPSLHELHRAPSEGHPVWSEQLFALLTKTAIPESGRVMMYDDLAGLYSHHLNMFELHTQQEPFWNIVQMATFVLDIADEEIFNKLCASAKAGQALRLSREQI